MVGFGISGAKICVLLLAELFNR